MVVVATLACVASFGVAACGGMGGSGDDTAESSSAADGSSPSAQDAEGVATGGGAEAAGGVTATPELAVAAADRQQVFTANVVLGVDQLDDAVAEAARAVDGLGGFAATEDVDLSNSLHATIVYRVPNPQFRPALAALSEVGDLREQSIDSTDVTSQYADLEGRVTTLRTSIGRLQGFLDETTDVNQIASLEGELTRREAELESIEAQRRSLEDQVTLSTITVSFDGATASPAPAADRPGFMGGLDVGRDLAATLVAAALATIGFLVPFLPVVAVLALAAWWWRRRVRRARPTTPGDPQPLAG